MPSVLPRPATLQRHPHRHPLYEPAISVPTSNTYSPDEPTSYRSKSFHNPVAILKQHLPLPQVPAAMPKAVRKCRYMLMKPLPPPPPSTFQRDEAEAQAAQAAAVMSPEQQLEIHILCVDKETGEECYFALKSKWERKGSDASATTEASDASFDLFDVSPL